MIRFELLSRFAVYSFFRSLYEQQEGRSARSHTRGGERVYGEAGEGEGVRRGQGAEAVCFFALSSFYESFCRGFFQKAGKFKVK